MARNLGIVPVQPYFAGYINAIVLSGDITTAGDAAFDVPEHGTPRATYKGDITIKLRPEPRAEMRICCAGNHFQAFGGVD